MSRTVFGATFALVVLLAPSCPADFIDQHYTPTSPNLNALIVDQRQWLAQVFKVGRDGDLTRVEVEVARRDPPPDSPLILEIRSLLADGSPSTNVLASHTFAPSDVSISYSFIGFDLGADSFQVQRDDLFAIVLRSDSVGQGNIDPYAWRADNPGLYARGKSYINLPPITGTTFNESVFDYGFRTYLNTPQVVPEPATASLALAGMTTLAAAGWLRARAKRRTTAK